MIMNLMLRDRGRRPIIRGVGIEDLSLVIESRIRERRIRGIAGMILLIGMVGMAVCLILMH